VNADELAALFGIQLGALVACKVVSPEVVCGAIKRLGRDFATPDHVYAMLLAYDDHKSAVGDAIGSCMEAAEQRIAKLDRE
jgi:hypothetical protein